MNGEKELIHDILLICFKYIYIPFVLILSASVLIEKAIEFAVIEAINVPEEQLAGEMKNED